MDMVPRRLLVTLTDPLRIAFSRGTRGVRVLGWMTHLSVSGCVIRAEKVVPFGTDLRVWLTDKRTGGEHELPGVVRWTQEEDMGLQFRALGAKATHAVVEATKAPAPRRTLPDTVDAREREELAMRMRPAVASVAVAHGIRDFRVNHRVNELGEPVIELVLRRA
jgi:hypothetical protein